MRGRGSLDRVAVALAMASFPLAGCTFDFDRYDSNDAGPEAAGSEVPDGTAIDPRGDAGSDAAMNRDAGPACPMPTACFQQATSCGSACGQTHDACVKACPGLPLCVLGCTSAEQSCLGKCASTCITCAHDAGCGASTGCLDAAHS